MTRNAVWVSLRVVLAFALAAIAWAHAAAGSGLSIPSFRVLGPSFRAWPGELAELERRMTQGDAKQVAPALRAQAAEILPQLPLAFQALRSVALADAVEGRTAAALVRMQAVERLTRRDPVSQLWLIEHQSGNGDLKAVLAHYDVLLRTVPALRPELLRRLVESMRYPEMVRELTPYVQAPWFPVFVQTAAKNPSALVPVASLLMNPVEMLPSLQANWANGQLILALMQAGHYSEVSEIYARHSEQFSKTSLVDLSLNNVEGVVSYAPFTWVTGERNGIVARFERTADGLPGAVVELEPFTSGVALARTFLHSQTPVAFTWNVGERVGTKQSLAQWRVTCLETGQSVTSGNLFAQSGAHNRMQLPTGCRVMTLQLMVNGGSVSGASRLDVANLRWVV